MFIYKKQTTITTTYKNKNIRKLKNEFANIKLESKTTIETKYEALMKIVKDELLKIYIPYFEKVAHGKFTDYSKNRIVCEIMKHHEDLIEHDDDVIVALHIMNMLNSLIH